MSLDPATEALAIQVNPGAQGTLGSNIRRAKSVSLDKSRGYVFGVWRVESLLL